MKEKIRKEIEKKRLIELIKATNAIKRQLEYPKKDISMIIQFHRSLRNPFFEEIVESLLGEYDNILLKLERYGENSNFWSRNESYAYKASDAKSKRPSVAWLRSKVKFYESQTA